jgi:hypothetical protein
MKQAVKGVVVVAATAASGVVAQRVVSRRKGRWPAHAIGSRTEPRWRFVTIDRAPQDVLGPGGALPPPLDELADRIEVKVRPAPGNRGTELGVRLRDGEPAGLASLTARATGDDPRLALRSALRQAKQRLETGEVLRADENQPTTHPTLAGKALDLVARRAGGEGRL